jgi:hypothetical protein
MKTQQQRQHLATSTMRAKSTAKKYPAYTAGKNCANCMLYQGKPTDAWANCAALGGKQVNGKGWCMAWAKKA